MKIVELHVDDKLGKNVGLANFSIKRLGSIVALIGKNGSGKSRVLNLLPEYVNELNYDKGYVQHVDSHSLESNGNGSINLGLNQKSFKNELRSKVVFLESEKLMHIDLSQKDDLIDLERLIQSPTLIDTVDNVRLTKSAIYYLNTLSTKLLFAVFNASRKNQNVDSIPNKQLFDLLAEIVRSMMGMELNYDGESDSEGKIVGMLTINNSPFKYEILSPGQKILFSYSVYLFLLASKTNFNLRDSIVVIDEPENHLHPEAQLQLIDGVHSIVRENGQLWIATHSVHILSVLQPEEIFYVESNNVRSPSSFTPSNALKALTGYDYNNNELVRLLLSNSEWAFAKFTANCLLNPNVIQSANQDDPQFNQFLTYLRSHQVKSILDFGAGFGRLEKALIESKENVTFRVDAYEPNKNLANELAQIPIISNVITHLEDLEDNEYELIVMANVLHEIPVQDWEQTFKSIKRALHGNGFLMILEDLVLPYGEAPNDIGYLVLNAKELQELFGSYEEPICINTNDDKYNDRIMCAVFKSSDLSSWGGYKVKSAIEMLKRRCLTNIISIRKGEEKLPGRVLAFYNQQYINCELAIQRLNRTGW